MLLAGALLLGGCDADRSLPSGSLYITSGQTDEVVRLDARDGSIIRRIPVDRLRLETDEPHAVAVAPDGRHWYVTVAHGQPSLWKFETDGDRLIGRVDLPSGGAAMIGLSGDGSVAYVPDYDRVGGRIGRVAAIRLHDLAVVAHAAVCGAPHDAALDPAGGRLAIACSGSDEIVLLDPATLAVLRRIAAPGGARPMSLEWSPDGSLLAVALHAADAVWLLGRDGVTRAMIPVGEGPAQVVFLDDDTLITVNRMGATLSIVDLASEAEVRRIALDATLPHGVAIGEEGRIAFVSYEGTPQVDGGVVAVDLESGRSLWRRDAGRYVLGIAYLPD